MKEIIEIKAVVELREEDEHAVEEMSDEKVNEVIEWQKEELEKLLRNEGEGKITFEKMDIRLERNDK
ncbi:hypothetical protein [Halobacillus ihumii]|uniref:hypothetical protein n=1 Tax=Halobacillus ihumii TaxID=2686092 RepID=UPI0013D150C1|nr:hypothetical protein [Halobacillus ihumii]